MVTQQQFNNQLTDFQKIPQSNPLTVYNKYPDHNILD